MMHKEFHMMSKNFIIFVISLCFRNFSYEDLVIFWQKLVKSTYERLVIDIAMVALSSSCSSYIPRTSRYPMFVSVTL